MKLYQRGFVLKVVSWIIALVVLALAGLFGINATDETLSEEAKAAMNVAPLPAPSDDNGFLDFLALGAAEDAPTREVALKQLAAFNAPDGSRPPDLTPGVRVRGDKRLPRCRPEEVSCLDAAAGHPQLRAFIDSHQPFLRRYRAMRLKPRFIDLTVGSSPDQALPAFGHFIDGQHLALLTAAVAFNSGNRTSAIRELELEDAFYRRAFNEGRNQIVRVIAVTVLDRSALFAAEIARHLPRGEKASWSRLEAITRAPTRDELKNVEALRWICAQHIGWILTRRHVRLSDDYYRIHNEYSRQILTRPWWDPVAPYLYRPHQTANRFVAQLNFLLRVAEAPSSDFFTAAESAREQARALAPGAIGGAILNPAGRDHPLATVVQPRNAEVNDITLYIGRMHGHQGMQSLVQLQVKLRAAGISEPRAVAAALAGPLGMAHTNPFTGKPMHFDEKSGTIGFDAPETLMSYAPRQLIKQYGRVAIPL